MGESESAIARFQEALILDSEDHQNLRYQLAVCLLVLNRDDEVESLLKQFNNDDGVQWSYTRALWQFRRTGAGRESNAALDDAFNSNRILPLYLVGLQEVPRRAPQDIGAGSAIEARDYLIANIGLWLQTQGALIWMAERLVKRLHDLETAPSDFTKSYAASTSELPAHSLIGTRPGT